MRQGWPDRGASRARQAIQSIYDWTLLMIKICKIDASSADVDAERGEPWGEEAVGDGLAGGMVSRQRV
jgi:hypothetical protein